MTVEDKYLLREPGYGDTADIQDVNHNTDLIANGMYQNRLMIGKAYDPDREEPYMKDDLVVKQTTVLEDGSPVAYNFAYYKALEDNITGVWNPSKWELTDISTELATKGEGGADVTKNVTGNPVEFTDGASAPLVKCVTEIQGSQDLHGYDKPWVGGAGKNKFKITATSIPTAAILTDDDGNIVGIKISKSGSGVATIYLGTFTIESGKTYTMSGSPSGAGDDTYRIDARYGGGVYPSSNEWNDVSNPTITATETKTLTIVIRVGANYTADNVIFRPQIEEGSTATTFAPYSNICPITAYTEGEIEVSDGDGNVTTHTTTFPSAIYRGSEDVVNGTETHDMVKVVFDGSESWLINPSRKGFYIHVSQMKSGKFMTGYANYLNTLYADNTGNITGIIFGISNSYIFVTGVYDIAGSTVADWRTYLSNHNLEVAFELATPTTSSVTPTNLPIKSLNGYNHIESSTGDMEVEYITEEYQPLVDLIEENSGNVTQNILYTASTMSEIEIDVDLTAYDEYIFFANDVLATSQIPQGNSLPKAVVEYIISNNPTLVLYGYDDCSCIYTVSSNKLTYSSGRGGYRITMIVGIKNGNVTRSVQTRSLSTRSLSLSKGETSESEEKTEELPEEEEKAVNEPVEKKKEPIEEPKEEER